MKVLKAITPLMWRVIAFLGLFVLVSGVAGPRIIASDIFFRDGFSIYGAVGKALVFGIIAFALLARRKPPVAIKGWRPGLLGWFIASTVALWLSWIAVDALIAGQHSLLTVFFAHAGLILSVACAGLGCFGLGDTLKLVRVYKQELIIASGIAIAFMAFLHAVYALWQPLASVVMYGVGWLLQITGLTVAVVPPTTIVLDKFGITVAESCSGVESIALFTGLYVIIGVLDWPKLRRKVYFAVFPLALLILGILNIVRVYGLIVAGYYIDPHIAFSLFHTYAGLVFFIMYSALFWAIAYRHLVKPQPAKKEPHDATT
jgi:exosortase/archaeosortase family protein